VIGIERRLDALISSLTGVAGISGDGQALMDVSRSPLKSITINVSSVPRPEFSPLILTSGLFRLSERFLPSAIHFWIHIVVTVPFVLVSSVVFLSDERYDASGEGSPKRFWECLGAVFGVPFVNFSRH